jgi:hypothetical protein
MKKRKDPSMKLGALLALGVSLFSITAFAADDDYMTFVTSLEGNWSGQGGIRYYDGSGQDESFGFEMSMFRQGETNTWYANNNKRSQSTGSGRDGVSFYITGQFLIINHDSVPGSASIQFSTDHSIDYLIMEFGVTDFIDHYYHWEVSEDGLSGGVVTERNGRRISEERFSAQRGLL